MTPVREDRAPRRVLEAGTVVYAVGDIHGRADLLDRLVAGIEADARTRSEPRKVLVYLGDYVDRGPDSRLVIDRLIAQGGDGIERVFLKGNHEDAMLRFLDDAAVGRSWLGFGGDATLLSYGVDPFDVPPGATSRFEYVRARFRENLPAEHRAFLEGLASLHAEGGYFFAHAGVRPGVALNRQNPEDLMWIREEFLHSREDFGKVVVHGHTIRPRPEVRPNRIGVDTGAVFSDVLTCVVLSGAGHGFIQTS